MAGKLSKSTCDVSVSALLFAGLGWKCLKGRCSQRDLRTKWSSSELQSCGIRQGLTQELQGSPEKLRM